MSKQKWGPKKSHHLDGWELKIPLGGGSVKGSRNIRRRRWRGGFEPERIFIFIFNGIGSLIEIGALIRKGALISIGSLIKIGWSIGIGSLIRIGSLISIGSLIGIGWLIRIGALIGIAALI